MLLDITTAPGDFRTPDLLALAAEMKEQNAAVRILNCSPRRLLLVADSQTDFSNWKVMQTGCLQVSTKAGQLLMTLVGVGAERSCGRVKQILGATACVA
jgi:hypothetical protein